MVNQKTDVGSERTEQTGCFPNDFFVLHYYSLSNYIDWLELIIHNASVLNRTAMCKEQNALSLDAVLMPNHLLNLKKIVQYKYIYKYLVALRNDNYQYFKNVYRQKTNSYYKIRFR